MADRAIRPDYAPAPGLLLEETLQAHGISARELARRCGRSPKLMTEIVLGKATLEPETALQLEKVLSIDASIWIGLEAEYRLHLARKEDAVAKPETVAWARKFPLLELAKQNILSESKANADTIRQLLGLFGVASVEAFNTYCESFTVSYRHSPSFDTNRITLCCWLRLGEIEAERIPCAEFDKSRFLVALGEIRKLTRIDDPGIFQQKITSILADAGVAFVVTKPFSKMALSGVSRWISPRKALIQQTLRHMSNDHFWFTLFHEAAHLLLHSRKTVFVDGRKTASGSSQEESEANDWAAHYLVPRQALERFSAAHTFTAYSVRKLASDLGIAPGIVVGQLQKAGKISYGYLNELKIRYEWDE